MSPKTAEDSRLIQRDSTADKTVYNKKFPPTTYNILIVIILSACFTSAYGVRAYIA